MSDQETQTQEGQEGKAGGSTRQPAWGEIAEYIRRHGPRTESLPFVPNDGRGFALDFQQLTQVTQKVFMALLFPGCGVPKDLEYGEGGALAPTRPLPFEGDALSKGWEGLVYQGEAANPWGIAVLRWLRLDRCEMELSAHWPWFYEYDAQGLLPRDKVYLDDLAQSYGIVLEDILPVGSSVHDVKIGPLVEAWRKAQRESILQVGDRTERDLYVQEALGIKDLGLMLSLFAQLFAHQSRRRYSGGGVRDAYSVCGNGIGAGWRPLIDYHHCWLSPFPTRFLRLGDTDTQYISAEPPWRRHRHTMLRLGWLCSIMSVCGERGLWMLWENRLPVELGDVLRAARGEYGIRAYHERLYSLEAHLSSYQNCSGRKAALAFPSFQFSYEVNGNPMLSEVPWKEGDPYYDGYMMHPSVATRDV